MKFYQKTLLFITSVALLSGCSTISTTVIPKRHGRYEVVATAAKPDESQQGGIDKARRVCTQQGKKLVVEKNKATYQGAGKQLGAITGVLSAVALTTSQGHTAFGSTRSNTDYRTTITFFCE